ncbi:hypothetical protein TNIN_243331 [Trichonephila inaurata madagascariensis]|uniref:Endonuclease/exonuclease/phosphatase domain-containing protein n=1 Tax=Trichonephila inaurata madagascariensis TaxID=2747483 RepID=A0A8X6WUP4_9ARAC|nr:hypothetical protein TNIN_243331 [Trichonephila inaurata madagascariensis]
MGWLTPLLTKNDPPSQNNKRTAPLRSFSHPFWLPETERPTLLLAEPLAFLGNFFAQKFLINLSLGYADPFINILQLNVNPSRAAHLQAFVVAADLGSDNRCLTISFNKVISPDFFNKTKSTIVVSFNFKNCSILLINIYFPSRDFNGLIDELLICNCIEQNCLLIGDFNTRSPIWGYNHTDARGDLLIDSLSCRTISLFVIYRSWAPLLRLTPEQEILISPLYFSNNIYYLLNKWEVQGHEFLCDHRFIGVRHRGDLPVTDFYLKTKHGSQKFF